MGDDSADEPIAVRVLRAALHRFFHEGYYVWSRSDVERTLPKGVAVDTPYVQVALRTWDARGSIRLLGSSDTYLEVLEGFPPEEVGSFG